MKVVLKRPWIILTGLCASVGLALALSGCKPEELGAGHPTTDEFYDPVLDYAAEPRMPVAPKSQTDDDIAKKSTGCMTCHKGIENPSMHDSSAVKLGCTDCHGGTGTATDKVTAHVHPRGHWYSQKPTFVKRVTVKEDGDKKADAAPAAPAAPAPAASEAKPEEKKESGEAKSKAEHAISVTAQGDESSATFAVDDTKAPAPDAKPAAETKADEKAAPAPVPAPAPGPVVEEHGYESVTDRKEENDEHGTEHYETAGNPKRSNIAWLQESPEFIRFVNPGDLRVARYSCGECHADECRNVPRSMMAHGAMLRGAALYNNGAHNQKIAKYGEAYTLSGTPARLQTVPPPTPEMTKLRGILPSLDPLPRYNVTMSGNILRAFERGGKLSKEIGIPNTEEEGGKNEFHNSTRGYGTKLSTDPVFLGIQKTRLFDPILWNLGTNDQSGDYRSSGCSACHVIYANDRDPAHSGPYAKYGKHGTTFSKDETMKEVVGRETGHPIAHKLTSAIPSAQCVVCHMHPGTTVTNTYYGTLWWDNETEGSKLYPKEQKKVTEREAYKIKIRNPEGAALRGLWGDVDFLESVFDHNDDFKQVQFADFNGHGWLFRNIYKQDLHGNLLDKDDKIVPFDSPNKFKKGPAGEPIAGSAVHMQDIHLEKGMHCIDCHFNIDNHGNGNLYGEVRNATEIMCADCHGTIYKKATLKTSGNAAPDKGGTDLSKTTTSFGKRFKWEGDKLYQQSAVNKDMKWEVIQTVDTITPGSPHYNEQSRYAKTMRRDAKSWGDVPTDPKLLAHQDEKMDCYVCHTGFMASCFGCHLPMRANQARFNNHYEGGKSRNWTQYNFQTLRDDCFMLGIDGTVKHNKVAPVRSMCAVIVSSQNAQREWIYSQQQTISAEGFSGQSFAPHYPHNVRSKETKHCSDCHVSQEGNNNAHLAQTYLLGTNQTNFMYRFVYAGNEDGGFSAVTVTEHDEPQAVIGSTLHRDAYPEEFEKHLAHGRELDEIDSHPGTVLGVQLRGEYLYAARGKGGMTVYDIHAIDNKGFSEKMVTAPVSPLGQRLYVKSSYCTSVISPTVLGVDPTRQPPLRPRNPMNQEQGISLTYAFLYCTDRDEGLFTVMAGTLLDGDPTNNFLKRHMTFNPGGILCGAKNGTVAGNYLYIVADAGLVVIDISKIGTELAETATRLNPDGTKVIDVDTLVKNSPPADPDLLKVVSVVPLNKPNAVHVQFRYAFVTDADGLKVIDVTEPTAAKLTKGFVPFKDARNVYLSRTYAYVAAGCEGLGLVDIETAEAPKLEQMYNANGALCDVCDVKVGMTNASVFAYVANGGSGLAVLQMTSPEAVPTYLGWASKVKPELIATAKLHGRTVALSEGLQRDRGVDESGNQLSCFNRVGSRPFNKAEMEGMYKIDGKLFTVSDKPFGEPLEMKLPPGTVDPKLKAKIEELEDALKKERNPAKKKKIQEELEPLKKQAEEQAAAGGADDKVKDLEEQIAKERNPAKKKKLQAELEELKKKK